MRVNQSPRLFVVSGRMFSPGVQLTTWYLYFSFTSYFLLAVIGIIFAVGILIFSASQSLSTAAEPYPAWKVHQSG